MARRVEGESGYIEVLNAGLLRSRRGGGSVRDPELWEEAAELDALLPPTPVPEAPEDEDRPHTTIRPPSWKKP